MSKPTIQLKANKGKGKVKTPNVHFSLKQPNSKKSTLIRAVFRYEAGKLVYSTKHKILPSYWNKKKEVPHNLYKDRKPAQYAILQEDLREIEKRILEVHTANPFTDLINFKAISCLLTPI